MYRTDVNNRDRGGAIALVLAIHAGLLLAFLHLSGKIDLADPQSTLKVFDVTQPPPPPPPAALAKPKPKNKEGGSAPPKCEERGDFGGCANAQGATAAAQPNCRRRNTAAGQRCYAGRLELQGRALARGAPVTAPAVARVATGLAEGAVAPFRSCSCAASPRAITRRRSCAAGRAAAPSTFACRIEPDGRPSRCDVMRSFGNASADQWTCSLIMQRGRFRPALDARGVPISAWFGYKQADSGR